jgi:hypothetical protein
MPEEESASPLKDIAHLVPSVYYDLISRVSVGVPFVLAAFYCMKSESKVWELENNLGKPGFTLALLLVGYIAGLLLSSISYLVEIPLNWWVWRRFRKSEQTHDQFDGQRWSQMDEIAIKNKEMGATLVKMMAETALCENLLTGFLVLLVLGYSYGRNLVSGRFVAASFLLVVLVWAVCHRATVTHYRQERIYAQLFSEDANRVGSR